MVKRDGGGRPVGRRGSERRRLGRLLAATLALLGLAAAPASDWADWHGTPPRSLSGDLPAYALGPAIAVGPAGLMATAWANASSENAPRDIYVAISNNNGATWASPARIATVEYNSWSPEVTIVGGEISVVWIEFAADQEPDVVREMTRASNGTWSEPRTIPGPSLGSGFADQVRAAAGGGRLHLVFNVWNDVEQQDDIFYAARPLTATTWPTAAALTQTPTWERHPDVAVSPDGETIHVVWEVMNSMEDKRVLYASGVISGGGATWSAPITLSTGIARSVRPAIAAGPGDDVHVIWDEEVGGGIHPPTHYVRYTRYDGSAWSAPQRIGAIPVSINYESPAYIVPTIALWNGGGSATVCAAWQGYRQEAGASPAEEIVVSCAPVGTANWSQPRRISRSDEDLSILPSIAFDAAGRLHAVWQEYAGGNLVDSYRVYYARELAQVFLPVVTRGG